MEWSAVARQKFYSAGRHFMKIFALCINLGKILVFGLQARVCAG
jgi:hypothetical protein